MSLFNNNSGTPISKIEYKIYNALVNTFDSTESWKTIVDFIRKRTQTNFEISGSSFESPGRKLLIELDHMNGTKELLSDILYECKIYDALSLLRTENLKVLNYFLNENILDKKLLVKIDNELKLKFLVFGLPLPSYIWYRNGTILLDEKKHELKYQKFILEHQGQYYCKAIQTFGDGVTKTATSEIVNVEVFPEQYVILKKPLPKICKREGDSIHFKVKVSGYPPPQYEWTHNNKVLQTINGNEFFKLQCSTEDSGTYRCRIWNSANEIIVTTHISILDSGYLFPVARDAVVEKIALLIGNEQYINHRPLKTPENDVDTLQQLLEDLGFLVIKRKNLGILKMKEIINKFSDMLVEGAYVLVYFAGHGFELGEKYFLPVDAPPTTDYSCKDCICDCQILRDVLKTKPKLFMFFLDMCLELPNRTENEKIYKEQKEVYDYEPESNLVQAYATSSRLSSYEIGVRDTTYNSVYIKALKEYIGQDLPILKILAKVNCYVQRFYRHFEEKQIPLLSFNIVQDFYLNVEKQGHPWTLNKYKIIMN